MMEFRFILFAIFVLVQSQLFGKYVEVIAQSNSISVKDTEPFAGVSVLHPAQLQIYVRRPGRVKILVPFEIFVTPIRSDQANVPARNGNSVVGPIVINRPANQYPASINQNQPIWQPINHRNTAIYRPFPVLQPPLAPPPPPPQNQPDYSRRVDISHIRPLWPNYNSPHVVQVTHPNTWNGVRYTTTSTSTTIRETTISLIPSIPAITTTTIISIETTTFIEIISTIPSTTTLPSNIVKADENNSTLEENSDDVINTANVSELIETPLEVSTTEITALIEPTEELQSPTEIKSSTV